MKARESSTCCKSLIERTRDHVIFISKFLKTGLMATKSKPPPILIDLVDSDDDVEFGGPPLIRTEDVKDPDINRIDNEDHLGNL